MNENASPLTWEEKERLKPEIHHAYSAVGGNLSKGNWGHTTKETRRERIKALSEREETTSLLAFIGHTLAGIQGTVQGLALQAQSMRDTQARSARKSDRHSISDGYYHVMIRQVAQSKGEILIQDCDLSQISARAMSTLRRFGDNKSYVSDITEESLLEVNGCGATTTQELLAWQDGILNPNGDDK